MYNNTADLRSGLRDLLIAHEKGEVTNTTARVRVNIVKAIIDTVKVEIAAASLGGEFEALALLPSSKR